MDHLQPLCPGCGIQELHKMCIAHGTEAYMNPQHPAWGNKEAILALKEPTPVDWEVSVEQEYGQVWVQLRVGVQYFQIGDKYEINEDAIFSLTNIKFMLLKALNKLGAVGSEEKIQETLKSFVR